VISYDMFRHVILSEEKNLSSTSG